MSRYISKIETVDTQFATLQKIQSITSVEEIVKNFENYEKKSTEMYARLNILENEIEDVELQINQKSRQILQTMASINFRKELKEEEIFTRESD